MRRWVKPIPPRVGEGVLGPSTPTGDHPEWGSPPGTYPPLVKGGSNGGPVAIGWGPAAVMALKDISPKRQSPLGVQILGVFGLA